MKLTAILVLCLISLGTTDGSDTRFIDKCTGGKVRVPGCSTVCPPTCARPIPGACVRLCDSNACRCPDGLVDHQGTCVSVTDCPGWSIPTSSPEPCTGGKVRVLGCSTVCPRTCSTPDPQGCPRLCDLDACRCPLELVDNDGTCITPSACPVSVTTSEPTTQLLRTRKETKPTSAVKQPSTKSHTQMPTTGTVTLPPTTDSAQTTPVVPSTMQSQTPGEVPSTLKPQPSTHESTVAPPTRQPPPACTGGKVFTQCMNACPRTCDSPTPRVCRRPCRPGCRCSLGFVEYKDRCIRSYDCPKPPRPQPACPGKKIYKQCGESCTRTCSIPYPRRCNTRCYKGCQCPDGLVEHYGACVELGKCPNHGGFKRCFGGKVLMWCVSPCPAPTCDRPSHDLCPVQTYKCYQTCRCHHGLLDHHGICVTRHECPTNRTPPPVCPQGKVYRNCACRRTCEYPIPPCSTRNHWTTQDVCFTGCTCEDGLLETRNGRCVRWRDCTFNSRLLGQ